LPTNNPTYFAEDARVLDRGAAFSSCFGGRRFGVTHQTPGTTITGQSSFVSTTPTFLIYQASASRRLVLSNFSLGQDGTPAGGTIHVLVAIEAANRYSSGGTSITPQNTNGESDNSAAFTFKYNPTATSPGSVRYLYSWTQPVSIGGLFTPDLQDGVIIGATGSILIYTWASTVAPSWTVGGFDIMEDG
jgi:hypothetical protein